MICFWSRWVGIVRSLPFLDKTFAFLQRSSEKNATIQSSDTLTTNFWSHGGSIGEQFGDREPLCTCPWRSRTFSFHVSLSSSRWTPKFPDVDVGSRFLSSCSLAVVFRFCHSSVWIMCSLSHTHTNKDKFAMKKSAKEKEGSTGLLIVKTMEDIHER